MLPLNVITACQSLTSRIVRFNGATIEEETRHSHSGEGDPPTYLPRTQGKNGDFIWESLKDSTLSQWSKFLSIISWVPLVGPTEKDTLPHDILIHNAQTYCLHEKTGMPEQRSVLVIMRSVFSRMSRLWKRGYNQGTARDWPRHCQRLAKREGIWPQTAIWAPALDPGAWKKVTNKMIPWNQSRIFSFLIALHSSSEKFNPLIFGSRCYSWGSWVECV